jgi:hypothetical protein
VKFSGAFHFWREFESLRTLISTEIAEFENFISDFSKFSDSKTKVRPKLKYTSAEKSLSIRDGHAILRNETHLREIAHAQPGTNRDPTPTTIGGISPNSLGEEAK